MEENKMKEVIYNYETIGDTFYSNVKSYEEEMNEICNMTREEVRSENLRWEAEDRYEKMIERNKKINIIKKRLSKMYKEEQEVRSRVSLFLNQSDF